MKGILAGICIIFSYSVTVAQDDINSNMDFGLNGSIGVRFESIDEKLDYEPLFECGLYVNLISGEQWRFGAELNYILMGFSAREETFLNLPEPYYRSIYIDRIHMICIPIGMYRSIGEKTYIGLGYSYNNVIKYRSKVDEWNTSPAPQPALEVRNLDLALFGDLQYSVSPSVKLQLRYRHGIVSVVHHSEDRYNRWVSCGLLYSLLKK